MPWWLRGLLWIDGMYLATAWVVSVMLPPMAIFFPLFTLLEDFGYLPRVAFNLDRLFKKAGAHGKQALTMRMGFGCNAAGVDRHARHRQPARAADRDHHQQLRPLQRPLADADPDRHDLRRRAGAAGSGRPGLRAAAVVGVALLGRRHHVRGRRGSCRGRCSAARPRPSASSCRPTGRPAFCRRSTPRSSIAPCSCCGARSCSPLPAGAVIWLVGQHVASVGEQSGRAPRSGCLDPLGLLIGLNGVILLAYIVAIPANEIVIPTVLMLTVLATGATGVRPGRRRDVRARDAERLSAAPRGRLDRCSPP